MDLVLQDATVPLSDARAIRIKSHCLMLATCLQSISRFHCFITNPFLITILTVIPCQLIMPRLRAAQMPPERPRGLMYVGFDLVVRLSGASGKQF